MFYKIIANDEKSIPILVFIDGRLVSDYWGDYTAGTEVAVSKLNRGTADVVVFNYVAGRLKVIPITNATPLIMAVIEDDKKAIEEHAKDKKKINSQDSMGRTALMWAVALKNIYAIKVLLDDKTNADMDITDINGKKAIDLTLDEEIRRYLVECDMRRHRV